MSRGKAGRADQSLRELSGITEQLTALGRMTVGELREQYREVYGEPTRSRNKDYLRKQVAWRIQELAEGGLSTRARSRLEELATNAPTRWRRPRGQAAISSNEAPAKDRDPRLPSPGSAIRKTYKGAQHLVTVRADGFEHAGRFYPSLSAVAKAITGTHWNGFLFFGLKKRSETGKERE